MSDTLAQRYEPGHVLAGKYRLERELGAGGMGAVFVATNTLLDAPVAIKVLHASATPRPDLTKRFLLEARAAAQVRHPNIVGILDVGEDEASGALFIVQEYLQGTDLRRHLARVGPMSPREALDVLIPVMRALAFAHSRGVIHRDLKPDNIVLAETPEGTVPTLIDFGIAKVLDPENQGAGLTSTMQVLGTPYFMSPEQASGDRAIDARADVWSLGVVLYHLLTQRYPHEGPTINLVISRIIVGSPTPITTYAPDLPPCVVDLVGRALVDDPDRRFPSMDVFAREARVCLAALDHEPPPRRDDVTPASPSPPRTAPAAAVTVPHRARAVPPATTVAETPSTTLSAPPSTTLSEVPSRPRPIWMAVAAAIVVAAAGGYFAMRQRPPAPRAEPTTAVPVDTPATPPEPAPPPVVPVTPVVVAVPPVAAVEDAAPAVAPPVAARRPPLRRDGAPRRPDPRPAEPARPVAPAPAQPDIVY